MATNRADTLDPALLRPGRLDRKIEFPLPSRRERRLVFQTCTSKMNLGPDVDLEDCALQGEGTFTASLKTLPLQMSPGRIGYRQPTSHLSYREQDFKVIFPNHHKTHISQFNQPFVKTDMLSCLLTLKRRGRYVWSYLACHVP
jgi:hypothetical protein